MWEYKSGSGRWKNYVNPETGEQSIKEHAPRLVKTWCSEHRFDNKIPANRVIECLDCGQEVTFVVGRHILKDGRIKLNKRTKL